MVSRYDPQVQGFSCSPSALKSTKRGNSRYTSIVSSVSVDDDDCYVNQESNLQYEPLKENVHNPKSPIVTPLNDLVSKSALNLVLSQSIEPTISTVTTEVETSAQHLINHKTATLHDGLVFSSRGYGISLITYMREVSTTSIYCPFETIKNKNKSSCTKKYQLFQCLKLARGVSGLCISHGGRKVCIKNDCEKVSKGNSIFYKFHGDRQFCEQLGVLNSAIEGNGFCIAHGDDNCCNHVNCTKISRAMSELCIKHGGGRRCKKDKCPKFFDNRFGLCIAHGGGECCLHKGCTKSVHDISMLSKSHDGGKRSSVKDCNKVGKLRTNFCKRLGRGKHCLFRDEDMCSKSIHGGTKLCVVDGCGKKCVAPKCTGSTQNGTNCCSHHRGDKRCQHEGHDKSAHGWTNFCKARGDNRRYLWGSQEEPYIDFDGPSYNHFSTSKFGYCSAHNALVQDHRVHGGKNLRTLTSGKPIPTEKLTVTSMNKLCLFDCDASSQNSLLEGRVRGGNLMTLLAKRVSLNQNESQVDGCNTSNQVSALTMNYGCF